MKKNVQTLEAHTENESAEIGATSDPHDEAAPRRRSAQIVYTWTMLQQQYLRAEVGFDPAKNQPS